MSAGDLYRKMLGKGCDVVAGSKILAELRAKEEAEGGGVAGALAAERRTTRT